MNELRSYINQNTPNYIDKILQNSLLNFYHNLGIYDSEHYKPYTCEDCNRCCREDSFMVLETEYLIMLHYLNFIKSNLSLLFHKMSIEEHQALKRSWNTCRFYQKEKGCLIYPARPLACRMYGQYMPSGSVIEECGCKTPTIYSHMNQLPIWKEYDAFLNTIIVLKRNIQLGQFKIQKD